MATRTDPGITPTRPDPRLEQFLHDQGLARPGDAVRWRALAGGVSSDIWRVDINDRSLCVKCALPKLKVASDWFAPPARNHYEWQWMQFARAQSPALVPQPVAHDPDIGALAMEFLEPERHPIWKAQLMAGDVRPAVARNTGHALGKLHAASARNPGLARQFDTDDIFYPIRLEPYLIATAHRHPALAAALTQLADDTLHTHKALVHGDVSPKNILLRGDQPIFLDAECAWFGDPAFDLAFCLNHLLLKCLVRPDVVRPLLDCFEALRDAYLAQVDWEPPADLERRAARLLPGLFLARIDGKSPVEYVTAETQKQQVRDVAFAFLGANPPDQLAAIAAAWATRVAGPG